MNHESFWEKTWRKHLQGYLSAIPRTGVFLSILLNNNVKKVLEIGCGSGRDSVFLAKNGYSVIASDTEPYPLLYLKHVNSPLKISYMIIDSKYLPFKDKSLDATFHNGLFIYLNDEEIHDVLREQERVAKKYIIFFVHNEFNSVLVRRYNQLAKEDRLYRIKFFTPGDVESIIHQSGLECESLHIFKFGGKVDKILSGINSVWARCFHQPISSDKLSLVARIVFTIYQTQMWRNTERIVCVLKLK